MIQITENNQIMLERENHREILFDFNDYYRNAYPLCRFTAAISTELHDYIAGTDQEGKTHLFVRVGGEVWEERNIDSRFHWGKREDYGDIKNILFYGKLNQLFLITENGYLITVPDCPKCVRVWRVSEEKIKKGWLEDKTIHIETINKKVILYSVTVAAQFRCAWSFAENYIKEKGALIDLRDQESRSIFKIPNAIPFQADQLEKLLKRYPKDRYIFYVCERGMKADEAAKLSREKGFTKSYSLGGEGDVLIDYQADKEEII